MGIGPALFCLLGLGLVLGLSAAPARAQTTTTSEDTSPAADRGADDDGDTPVALAILILGGVLGAAGVVFGLVYHGRLMQTVDTAIARGLFTSASTTDTGAVAAALALEPGIKGPASATVGSTQWYTAVDDSGAQQVAAWSIQGDVATATLRTDAQAERAGVEFRRAGSVSLNAVVNEQSYTLPITVAAAGGTSAQLTLPFVVRNWGRLLVILAGVAVVGALMASNSLSDSAGAGILGAILGVGAVAGTGSDSQNAGASTGGAGTGGGTASGGT